MSYVRVTGEFVSATNNVTVGDNINESIIGNEFKFKDAVTVIAVAFDALALGWGVVDVTINLVRRPRAGDNERDLSRERLVSNSRQPRRSRNGHPIVCVITGRHARPMSPVECASPRTRQRIDSIHAATPEISAISSH